MLDRSQPDLTSTTNFLREIHPIDESILSHYFSQFELISIPKKTILTAAGSTERYLYLVLEGFQKSFYLHEGKEYLMAFTYPPSFSGIPESFFNQNPSKYFLNTITDSQFLRISFENHEKLIQDYRPLETLFRKFLQLVLAGVIERHHELMAFDIRTRFRVFMDRSGHLVNKIPHKDIASYLRIDPTNFSKLLGEK